MSSLTGLEALIRQLAGRDDPRSAGQPLREDPFQDQLNDPSSDASRFLEEIRQRTRSLFDEPTGSQLTFSGRSEALGLNHLFPGRTALQNERWPDLRSIFFVVGAIASLIVVAGLVWRAVDRSAARRSSEQTERILTELRTQLGTQKEITKGVVSGLDPVGPGSDLALRRLEVELASLNAKLDALSQSIASAAVKSKQLGPTPREVTPSSVAPPIVAHDPNYPVISADLAAIRRELVNSEAATTRQIQEMRTVLQEVNTVVRRVLSRPQPSTSNNVAMSVLSITVQALTNNLQHPSAQVRGEAVEQLVRIGAPARSALPSLQQMLGRETDPNIRSAIETALTVLSSN